MGLLICLTGWLIFSSFAPQTFSFYLEGTVLFKDQNKGSTEGIYILIYADDHCVSQSKVDEDLNYELEFLDLHYNKLDLYWKEEGTKPFYIMQLDFSMFQDQYLKLDVEI